MIKELMHDPIFLAGKSEAATKEDLHVAKDLLDTLIAHRERCVGKVSDEWFMKLSHKYDVELVEAKNNILFLKEKLDGLKEKLQSKDNFLKAVRSFMEMKTLNPVILSELVEKIEVIQIEGTGKNRTQRAVIHYRFVGCLQIPEWHRKRKITFESRPGVAVNYLSTTA